MKTTIGSEFWKVRFGAAYQLIWKDGGKSQAKFADRINEIRTKDGTRPTCTSQQVHKWLTGTVPSQENIDCIIEALDLPKDYFVPSHSDMYRESSEYITEIGKKRAQAAEEIGLDLNLVKSLSGMIDFGKRFPIYTPIRKGRDPETHEKTYYRPDSADSAPIDKSLEFLQFERYGKTMTMSDADLLFLKEVQDRIGEYVKYLFYERANRMSEIIDDLNEDLVELTSEELKEKDAIFLR